MKNIKKKLGLLIAACLFVVGFAHADGDKEDDGVTVCDILPIYCGATTSGNGGGVQPPPKH